MTKQDLIDAVAGSSSMTKTEATETVEQLLEIMKETIASGEHLKIVGFGRFQVNEKGERRGRNPQTGEEITLPGRRVATFKPSQILKANINGEPALAAE